MELKACLRGDDSTTPGNGSSPSAFQTFLAGLSKAWEVEAVAMERVSLESQSKMEQIAFRECAGIYRKCAAELKVRLGKE